MIRYGNPYFTIILQWLPWHRCFSYIQHIWLFQRFVMAGVGGWISPLLLIWQEYLISSKSHLLDGRVLLMSWQIEFLIWMDENMCHQHYEFIMAADMFPIKMGVSWKLYRVMKSPRSWIITNSMYNVGQFISFQLFGSLFADYFSAQLYPNSK